MPAAAFAVGFAVVIVRDTSEVTERTSSASLCKRWSRSASRAAIRRCSACSSNLASAFRFLRPGSWMAQRFREVGRKSFATAHARHLYRTTASLAPLLAIPGSDAASRMTRRPLPYAVVLVPADPPTADRRRATTDSEVSMCQHGLRVARELSALAANAATHAIALVILRIRVAIVRCRIAMLSAAAAVDGRRMRRRPPPRAPPRLGAYSGRSELRRTYMVYTITSSVRTIRAESPPTPFSDRS